MPPRADARAIKAQVVGSLASRVNLEVLTAGREVVQQSSRRWRRVTDSAPCGWCAMLAGRGPVYRSAEKAGSGGNRYHGHCGCTVEPFEGDPDEWTPTPDEQRFIDAYEATNEPGLSDAEMAARIERWMAENPAQIVARKSFAAVASGVKVPTFRTLAEVEQYLKNFTNGGLPVKLRGVSVAHATEVAEAVDQLFTAFPGLTKLHSIEAIAPTTKLGARVFSSDQAMASYEFLYGRLFLNSGVLKNAATFAAQPNMAETVAFLRQNWDRLSITQREMVERYTAAGRDLVDGRSVAGVIRHEFGHKIHAHLIRSDRVLADTLAARMDEYAVKVSGYATANVREYFAESFASFVAGEFDRIDPQLLAYFESLLG